MNRKEIDYIYKQNLEESIIEYLAKEKNIEIITVAGWQSRLSRAPME